MEGARLRWGGEGRVEDISTVADGRGRERLSGEREEEEGSCPTMFVISQRPATAAQPIARHQLN